MLLGGAAPMQGNVALVDPTTQQWQSQPLEEPPSFRQGFGRLDLSRTLPLKSSGKGWNVQVSSQGQGQGQVPGVCVLTLSNLTHMPPDTSLTAQVVDLATLTQGKSDSYCIYATGGPLHVTLAW